MTLRLPASGGATLAADAWGDEDAPPLFLLHGGGQTRGAWGSAGPRLAESGWRVLAVDLRGHGESDWAADGHYDLELFADDARALVRGCAQPPVVIGASLGGMTSLLAAGEPEQAQLRGLVLVDVAHRGEPKGIQRILDFMRARPEGFDEPAEAVAAVASYLPHREAPPDETGLARNLRLRDGRWVWHWDPTLLDGLTKQAATSGQPGRFLDAARATPAPILLVRGGISDVVSEDVIAEFRRGVPKAQFVEVPGAGHMVAGDRNERFVAAIEPFVAALP